MNHLIIIGHPDKNSFCYNGIFKKVKDEMWEDNVLQWLFGDDEKAKENLVNKILQ